jgi:hypothetical protein
VHVPIIQKLGWKLRSETGATFEKTKLVSRSCFSRRHEGHEAYEAQKKLLSKP